jgi:hypothetical protein
MSLLTAVFGTVIGWSDPPPADPTTLRTLLGRLGLRPGRTDEDLTAAVREFQSRCGLVPDGVAGPRTVHQMARYAR